MAARHGPLVVYPGQEGTIDELLGVPMPQGVQLPYPDVGALALLRDKRRLPDLAAQARLGSPETLIEATARELRGWSPPRQCVVKPARPNSALPTAMVAGSPDQLHAIVSDLPDDEPLLIQERARGPLEALGLVIDTTGSVVAEFQQVTRRTWPSEAGISTVAESVSLDEQLAARAGALLAEVGFAGLAQLQFVKVAGGRALIDVNPRFYGSLPLAIACGVNLPAAWHATVAEVTVPTGGGYRTGVLFHWLEGEALLAARSSSRPALALARAFVRRPRRPRTGAVWARSDPRSSAVFTAGLAAGVAGRRLRR